VITLLLALPAVFKHFAEITGTSIQKQIESDFKRDVAMALETIVASVYNKHLYFAEQLYMSMKGLGTDDRTLKRIVTTRCEIDLGNIKAEFAHKYKKTLPEWVASETHGHYRKLLLMLIGP